MGYKHKQAQAIGQEEENILRVKEAPPKLCCWKYPDSDDGVHLPNKPCFQQNCPHRKLCHYSKNSLQASGLGSKHKHAEHIGQEEANIVRVKWAAPEHS